MRSLPPFMRPSTCDRLGRTCIAGFAVGSRKGGKLSGCTRISQSEGQLMMHWGLRAPCTQQQKIQLRPRVKRLSGVGLCGARGAFGAAFRLQLVQSIGNRHVPVYASEPSVEPFAMQAVPHSRAAFDHLHTTPPFAELVSQIRKRV
jgi:hypothetical protein